METEAPTSEAINRLRIIAERFAAMERPSVSTLDTWPEAEPADLAKTLESWRQRHGLPLDGPDRQIMDTEHLGLDAIEPPDKVDVSPWHEDAPGLAPLEGPPLREDFPQPPEVLDKKVLRQFWNDAWTDDDGVMWQVRLQGSAGEGKAGGVVIRNDEVIGKWKRTINRELGIVQHDQLFLAPEAQGQGFASKWLGRCAPRYAHWGLQEVRLHSGLDGTFTWARKGFDLAGPDDLDIHGHPCAYEQSVYAQKMRDVLEDARRFWDSGDGAGLVDLDDDQLQWLYERSGQLLASPPRLPELAHLEPEFTKFLLRSSRVNLSRSVQDMLPAPDMGL